MSQNIIKFYQVQSNGNISLDAVTANLQNVLNNFCVVYAATQNVAAGNANVPNIGLGMSFGLVFDQTNANLQIGNTSAPAIYANVNVTGNIFTGNIILTQNANTGNINVLQNIVTGNANVLGNIAIGNVINAINSAGSPLLNTTTRAMTGLSINTQANVQTTATITGANILPVIFNEVGLYSFTGQIMIGAASGGQTNATNLGVNIAFMNSGTAVVNSLMLSAMVRSNGNTTLSNMIATNAQSVILSVGSTQTGSVSNSTNVTDYINIMGYANVNGIGTSQTMIAAGNTANANLNVMPNSWIVFTKIG